MMKFAICGDTQLFLMQLRKMIEQIFLDKNEPLEIDEFSSGEDFLAAFSTEKYDAVILDVQMKGLTGIQTAHEIRKTDRDVIIAFHTSFDSLDLDDYDVGRYIYMHKGQDGALYQKQFNEMYSAYFRRKAAVRLNGKDIPLCSILYFQGHWNGTRLYTDTETLELPMKLKEIEKNEQLLGFTKAHRRYYINTAAIRYVRDKSVSLKNGDVIPLSQRYRKSVERGYLDRLFERV